MRPLPSLSSVKGKNPDELESLLSCAIFPFRTRDHERAKKKKGGGGKEGNQRDLECVVPSNRDIRGN